MPDAGVADNDGGMTASLVYLLLRQVLQMLTQLARDGGVLRQSLVANLAGR
jgi:hypothetical protein